MTSAIKLNSALVELATYAKATRTNQGLLANLTTTDKNSLVAALNEVVGSLAAVAASVGAQIADGVIAPDQVWSSSKTANELTAVSAAAAQAVADLINGAPEAADTLIELNNLITQNEGVITTLVNGQAKRVAVDTAQTFTPEEQAQARTNMDAASATVLGDMTIDFHANVQAVLAA